MPIKPKVAKRFKVYDIISVIILFSATGMLIYSTWCGCGITYDSKNYIAAAESLRSSGELLNSDGKPFIAHAPLLPVLLSISGGDVLFFIRIFHVILFGSTMMIIMVMLRTLIKAEQFRLMAFAAIAFAVGTQMIYNFVWTEPLFLFFLAIHNWALIRFLRQENQASYRVLVLAALVMGLTRNAGFFIILATGLSLLLFANRRSSSLLYLFLGSLGFTIWNIYAFFLQGGANTIVEGVPFFTAIGLNFRNYLDVMTTWMMPSLVPMEFRILLAAIMIFILLFALKGRKLAVEGKAFLVQSILYTCIMILFISVDKSDVERLLAVIYPWLVIGIFMILDRAQSGMGRITRRIVFSLLCCWCIYVGARSVKNSMMWHQNNCHPSTLTK
jgi:hypothetical protein